MRPRNLPPAAKNRLPKLFFTVGFLLVSMGNTPAQTLTTLANFNGSNGDNPDGPLIQASDGNFYGTTSSGVGFNGSIFKMTPGGTLTSLYEFCLQPNCTDGAFPTGGLVQAADGNFYGTTSQGGTSSNCSLQYGCGTLFKITPTGTFTTLYSFCSLANCADGKLPEGTLLQGSDGNLYGTTLNGGFHDRQNSYGTVFKITPTGAFTTLYKFCSQQNCADGAFPASTLAQDSHGNLYGTTQEGGPEDGGTVFRITPSGALTTIYDFCSQPACADGYAPFAGLVQAIDGNFYGTTYLGGGNNGCNGYGCGTVFKLNPSGAFTKLHAFNATADGFIVYAPLVQATDGNLYGTTIAGGIGTYGTIFRVSPGGEFTNIYTFCSQPNCTDGGQATGGLLQGTDGNLYGATTSFGEDGVGTIYRLSTGLPGFVVTQPTSGTAGTPVTILGSNLSGATGVSFNGTAATINSNTGSAITTTVPAGATTGTVQVSLPNGTLNSDADFQVTGPLAFVPVTPCRLIDTRQSGGPIQGGTSENFTIPQSGDCGIPGNAAAYSLNVTVVPIRTLGYLTIWPQGEIQPYVSTMNSLDGRVKANAVIVPSGNNAVSVYVTDTTNIILDIDGYFVPASQGGGLQFYPLTPCRVVDTRATNFPPGLGAPSFGSNEARELPVLSNSPCLHGLPNTPLAYSFNVTADPHPAGQHLNYLTVWPSDQQQPVVSTLNNPTATVVANAAIVPAAANGDVSVYTYNSTDVLIDVNGYFAAPGAGGYSFHPVAPCRAFDSRSNNGQPFTGQITMNVAGSPCAPPATAAGYVFNATVVPSPRLPYLTLWPHGEQQPVVSTLNAYDGFVTSNMAIVPNMDGSTNADAAQGFTQLILDIAGYFAP